MAEDRVSTSIMSDVPGVGIFIVVRFRGGRGSVRVAERDMSRTVVDKVGECVRRHETPEPGRHTWVTVTWYASEGERTDKFPRILNAIQRSLAKVGIDAEHAHLTSQVVPSTDLVPTFYRYVLWNSRTERVGSRIEFDLIQPKIARRVGGANVHDFASVPGSKPGDRGSYHNATPNSVRCPVDHLASVPSTSEIYAIWSRVVSTPISHHYKFHDGRPVVEPAYASVHAELVASRRCPACPTEVLAEAPMMRAPNGQERATGRCPCCNARWLTDEPNGFACLDTGRLSVR
jgi:hypothetical protein